MRQQGRRKSRATLNRPACRRLRIRSNGPIEAHTEHGYGPVRPALGHNLPNACFAAPPRPFPVSGARRGSALPGRALAPRTPQLVGKLLDLSGHGSEEKLAPNGAAKRLQLACFVLRQLLFAPQLPWNNDPRKLPSAGNPGGTAARISVSHTGSRTAPRHQCPNADHGPGQTCIRATRTTARTASLPETNTLYTIPRAHAASCCSLRVRAPAPPGWKLPWNNDPRKLPSAGNPGGTAARISVSHTGSRTAPRHQCPNADHGPGQTCIRATRTTARTASLPETNTLYTIPRAHAASCCSLRVRAPAPPGWKLPWNNDPRKLPSAGNPGGTAARISVSHTGSRTAPRHQCPNADHGPGQTCIRATRTTARTASLPETNTLYTIPRAHAASCCSLRVRAPAPPGWKLAWNKTLTH